MPQRQSFTCLALGLLITAIVAVQLLLVHKQTAMQVPDLHPLETRQKAEANKLLQSLEDARQRLEAVQADLRRQQEALATERVALERLRNATAPAAQAAQAAQAAPAAPAPPTLIQGILMHVDRPENYLRRALASLLTECRETALLRLLVVDATPGAERDAFIGARRDHGRLPIVSFVRLASSGRRRLLGSPQKTARQARDVARAMRLALQHKRFTYAFLLEDDWVACPNLLGNLFTAVHRAEAVHGTNFAALRVSYGLNGIIVPRTRLASLAKHVEQRASQKPPDLAFTEWALQQNGKLVAYRHNLFVHVGHQSSVGNSGSRWNAACFELLFDWLQKGVEAFDVKKCAHDAISPCDPPPRQLPHVNRRAKAFACEVALMDLPVDRTSDRLLGCVRDRVEPAAKYLLPAPRMA
ncbi:unnamed protein product [Pelagomonas calceolata]|uniref:Uncharacterized protein n=1 Tax=Pelagomonas calceolata TaxID=35677 RepID=A0A8J2SF22_9STRA|nr:unnamed protein product [Pelagomonas calceolata]